MTVHEGITCGYLGCMVMLMASSLLYRIKLSESFNSVILPKLIFFCFSFLELDSSLDTGYYSIERYSTAVL